MEKERSNSHDRWVFDRNSDDLRGWPVVDRGGRRYGTVSRMLVDPVTEHIVEVEVEDGRRFSAHDLLIGDQTLTLDVALVARTQPTALTQPAPAPEVPVRAVKAEIVKPTIAVVPDPKPAARKAAQLARDERDDLLLQLLDEEISIEKRRVRSGGVHVETHLVAEPFEEEVRLRDERVTIDRMKVDRDVTAAEVERFFHDENLEISARAELPVVEKTARITEEVVLKRRADDHDEQIHETVRHMTATVTPLPADAMLARGGDKR